MGNVRPLNYSKYGISKNRFWELYFWCLQYGEWREELKYKTDTVKSVRFASMPSSHSPVDVTQQLAIRRVTLEENCRMIEQTASMKNPIEDINSWLYHRIRMCIWRQWKKPKTKMRNLIKLGVSKDLAYVTANSRRGHWFVTHTMAVNIALTKERLTCNAFYDLANAYQSVHVNY